MIGDVPLHGPWYEEGGCLFDGRYGTTEAWGLMLAAGVAWELAATGRIGDARGDVAVLKEMHIHTRPRVLSLAAAAGAMLSQLGAAHARLTRALLDHDLTSEEITRLARGERIDTDV